MKTGLRAYGLRAYVFKNPLFIGCDGKGRFSSVVNEVTILPSEDFPDIPQLFMPTDDAPAVVIVKRNIRGMGDYLTAYPADKDGNPDRGRSMGGAFISTSDSRFPATYPVPLHDRLE